MAKKALEEKIKNVGFWTFSFFAWYLIVAFFLKSNYPIYEYLLNRKDAYEVIKDALTLTAAFLAPVAAFVLYSEWQISHRLIKNEQLIENLHIEIRDINYKLSMLVFNLQYQANQNDEKEMLPYKDDLKNLDEKHFRALSEIERIKSKFENQDFFDQAKEYLTLCFSLIKDAEGFIGCNSDYNQTNTKETLGKRLVAYNKLMDSRIKFELNSYTGVVAIRSAADKYFI